MPIIDLAAVVPVVPCRGADRRREGRAHHPRPRPGNGRGGARGFRHAHHRRREGRANVPTAGSWCPSSRATARNGRGGARRADRRREGGARHAAPPCRSSTLPRWCPSCRSSTAGKVVPMCRRREGGAHHPGPRLATAAVVPVVSVVPIIDSREGRAAPVPRRAVPPCRRAAVPIDGGKLVPIIDAGRCPGSWCRDGPPSCPSSTAGKVMPIIQGHGLASWCRAGSPSCRRVDRRREGRAHHRRRERGAAPPIDGGKLVPIIQGHGLASWCRAGPPSCRRVDRRREGRAAVPIIQGHGLASWCRAGARRAAVSIDGGKVVPIIQGHGLASWCRAGARRAAVSIDGGRVVPIIQGHGLASWCRAGPPSCRRVDRRREGRAAVPIIQGHGLASWCRAGARRAAVSIDGGKVVPIIQGHGSQRPRWCPSCRSTAGKLVPIIQGHGSQRPRWCPSAIADNAPPCRSTPAGVREGRAHHRRREGRAEFFDATARPNLAPAAKLRQAVLPSSLRETIKTPTGFLHFKSES